MQYKRVKRYIHMNKVTAEFSVFTATINAPIEKIDLKHEAISLCG